MCDKYRARKMRGVELAVFQTLAQNEHTHEELHILNLSGAAMLQIQNPCANSGFWYMRPSPAAIAFAEMLVDRLLFSLPWGWDQVAMNEVTMPNLYILPSLYLL